MSDPISPKYVDVQDEASDNSVLLEATREGVAVVLLNRPHKRNALDGEAIAALTEAFQTLQGAEGVRLVLLRGAGGVFSSGADIGYMRHTATLPEEDNRLDALDIAHMLKALYDIPALTVALVEGSAIGLGAGLVAACDMAISTADAQFGYPEVRLGLTSGVLSPYVIEAVGARAARRLFATGARIQSAEALRLGLVSEVVADGDALNAAQDQLATDILACAPGAIGAAKRLVRDQVGREIDRSLIEDSARRLARARVSPEGQEGLDAFLNHRKPSWAL
jgi:methylglutaconyl-CoA hydratase